jgi:hypothetical protein
VDTSKAGPAGPYWVWEYETVEVEGQPANRRFWDNTSLSEKAIGRLGKVFEAFGVDTDTDTEDLIGNIVTLDVGQETINKGDRMGEKRNVVRNVLSVDAHPAADDYADAAATATAGASAEEGDF